MSPRSELRAKRRAVRGAMADLRRRAREQLDRDPAVQKARRKRRARRFSGILLLLLVLALFARCQCEEPPPPPIPPTIAVPEPPKPTPPPKPAAVKPGPLKGSVGKQQRGKFGNDLRDRPAWLEDFHLQVSARSGRLAACFTGVERPGALRWAAALNAHSGRVADHELEPLGSTDGLSSAQRECVVKVLSEPPYRLKVPAAEDLPRRVGLVIEF